MKRGIAPKIKRDETAGQSHRLTSDGIAESKPSGTLEAKPITMNTSVTFRVTA